VIAAYGGENPAYQSRRPQSHCPSMARSCAYGAARKGLMSLCGRSLRGFRAVSGAGEENFLAGLYAFWGNGALERRIRSIPGDA